MHLIYPFGVLTTQRCNKICYLTAKLQNELCNDFVIKHPLLPRMRASKNLKNPQV